MTGLLDALLAIPQAAALTALVAGIGWTLTACIHTALQEDS